ncbi:hypothetical protein GO013_14655 [Pseudodesulfovibrio sp. JC047]|uniref:hypothetical protein n=1 Tax=Pseudodesulfovibrio sp. JC047 TaxID=2683199 RepID=UPI0013CF93E1|nr:hypothetical protein [Pseudodesulfovibrio sp. JC047]NDV20649.1 hypothetical protein [Pseudodesulfovibrio sp. JC047]
MSLSSPVSILVNPVESGPRSPLRHAARCGSFWYFVDADGLYRIDETALCRSDASLLEAERIPTPDGHVDGVLAFKGRLLIGVAPAPRNDCELYVARPGDTWRPAGAVHGRLYNWCRDSQGRYCFVVIDPIDKFRPEPRAILMSENGEDWREFEMITADEANHVHSICVVRDQLIVLVGDSHFNHLSIRVLHEDGTLIADPAQRTRVSLGLSHRSLYRVLPRGDGSELYALDGATELYDARGDFWKSDYAEDSGCQVAAHLNFPWAEHLLFLGTWRHSPPHPFPCLYIIHGDAVGKFVESSQPFTPEYSWFGFQDMDGTLTSPEAESMLGRFWPCAGGVSLYLKPLTASQTQTMGEQGIPCLSSEDLHGTDIVSLPKPPFIFST